MGPEVVRLQPQRRVEMPDRRRSAPSACNALARPGSGRSAVVGSTAVRRAALPLGRRRIAAPGPGRPPAAGGRPAWGGRSRAAWSSRRRPRSGVVSACGEHQEQLVTALGDLGPLRRGQARRQRSQRPGIARARGRVESSAAVAARRVASWLPGRSRPVNWVSWNRASFQPVAEHPEPLSLSAWCRSRSCRCRLEELAPASPVALLGDERPRSSSIRGSSSQALEPRQERPDQLVGLASQLVVRSRLRRPRAAGRDPLSRAATIVRLRSSKRLLASEAARRRPGQRPGRRRPRARRQRPAALAHLTPRSQDGRAPGHDRLAVEVALQVVGQGPGRCVAPGRVLVQALQADRLQVARRPAAPAATAAPGRRR